MSPLISILLPLYNAAPTLKECLGTIKSQTFEDFEVVAVDDGSTDESPDIISTFAKNDKRFRLIRAGRMGIVKALNRGLSSCRGKYVARMDGDDMMSPERLDLQLAYITDLGDLDLVGSLVRMIGAGPFVSSGVLKYEEWSNSLVSHEEIVSEIFVESPIVHPTFFARAEFFEKLGGYRDLPWAEDYDLIHRAFAGGARFGKVPRVLLDWRDSPGRLLRRDVRYRRVAMFEAKAHHFLRTGILSEKRGVVIAGTGPSGRAVARIMLAEGIGITSFIDNLATPDVREVMGIRAIGVDGPIPGGFFEDLAENHFIICIGERAGREAFIAALERAGIEKDVGYTRFI